ncbi:MAG: hypothetical protein WCW02_00315 [Candidatus Buchananbacteria bacterium]
MPELNEIFLRMQENKRQQKDIRKSFKDALASSPAYHEVTEQYKVIKEKKKTLENQVWQDFSRELEDLDKFRQDLKSDELILSDLAVNKILKGEQLKITDQYNHNYEPIIAVKFKKID